ncbi:MAG: beta-ketoacyl synthase [Gammaproteobacteria bacterium]
MTKTTGKIAITGIGAVSPLGHDAHSTWNALLNKESGIAKIQSFDASTLPAQIASEVKNFDVTKVIKDKKILRYALPQTAFALAASEEALNDAGIRPNETTGARWGLVLGSGLMTQTFDAAQKFQQRFASTGELDFHKLGLEGKEIFSAYEYGQTQTNCGLALISKLHNILGYSISVHTACASGGHALGLALQALRRGDADYILAGGFDSMIDPIGISGFCLLGALATDNETPTLASRPFDLTRNGFVLGEGAGFLVLEDWDKAKSRGAKIYAELAGEGNSLSSYRITDSHPSGDGAIQAIEGALKDANQTAEHVDYINAHGTSTQMNDFSETNAIKGVFKERAYQIPISSTKSQTGHLISAAGALEAVFSVLAIHTQQLPMTMNRHKPDPDCDLDYITDAPRKKSVRVAMSNSFGFGGHNSCLVFRHPEYEGVSYA